MNRIYKVIWSKVRHCYVVVSELVGTDRKSVTTRSRISKTMVVSLTVMALCAGMTSGVMAADTATGTGSGVAYGKGSKAPNAASVAVGNSANASGDFSIALGLQAESSGYLSIAQGYAAQASGLQSVAIGLQSQATNEASVALGRSVQATGLASIGIGLSGVAAGNDSIVMGREATATTTAVNGIALGIGSYIGAEVTPGGQPSVGVPDNSLDVTDDDTSSGKPNQDHMNSIALGNTAKAYGYQNTSLGAGAETYDTNSLAVGVAAHARGNYASAIGKQASAYGLESTALGHWARAYGDNTIAIGSYSITNTLDGTDSVNNAIAIGQKARVASNNSIALGQNSLAYIPTGVATKAYLTDEAFSADNGIVSVGNTEYKIGDDAVAENRRRITNVAGGADSYDAVNVAQLKAVNDKVDDNKISFFSVKPSGSLVTSNADNEGATGIHAMAIGIDASASGTEGIAIGKAAVSTGATSIAIGKKSSAVGSTSIAMGHNASTAGANAISIGNYTEGAGTAVALGHYAKATASQGVALGASAKAEKDSSVAIGYFAKATDGATNGVSIGRSASVTKSNGVALGYISVADRGGSITGYNPMTQTAPSTNNAAIAQAWGFADEYNALNTQLSDTSLTTEQKNAIRSQINKLISPYKSGYGAVSVGTTESTRQIINVAAGTEDSDAVNVAQLKALSTKMDNDKIQYFSVKSTITGNQDNSGATGTDTIAIGPNAKARYTGGIAIGKDASAAAGSMAALAIGYETSATGVASTALGVRAKATGSSVTAVGFDSVIKTASSGSGRTGDYSVALGVSSLVDGGKSAIAIGNNAYAIDTTQATVVGTGAMVSALPQNSGDKIVITDGSQGTKTITKDDDGEYAVESTKDTADALKSRNGEAYGATALGSRATAHNLGAVAVGLYSTAIGDTSVAIGNNSMTLKDSAVALGSGTIASAEDALSLGSYANASKDTAVALGAYAKTDREAGELFGYVPGVTGDALTQFQTDNADSVTWNSNRGAVSVGVKGKETRQITNLAAGTEDTDAVNVAQLKAVNTKVDANKISFFSVNPEGFVVNSNEDNKGATGSHAMAIGIDASATGLFDTAIGKGALAGAGDAIAIGSNSKSTGSMATAIGERSEATASSAVALGSAANASQNYAIAIGGAAKAKDYQTVAIGAYANALLENSIALGYLATAADNAYEGVAIGRSANVTLANGVALGSYSVTDRDGNYLGYDPTVGGDFVFTSEMQAALDAANAAIYERNQNPTPENDQKALDAMKQYRVLVAPWISGTSALSIGNNEEGLTRQITNVAAGSTDTDAVNVAQLKAAKVEVLAGKNISSIDKDTSEGYTRYTVNAKDTITDSAALNGDTITFTRNDGTTYTVSGIASTSALDTNKTRYFSVNSTEAANRNNDGATGAGALAAGVNAKATKTADTAIGNGASASGGWSIAAGAGSNASGTVAVAMGYGATAAANQAVAIGYAAKVTRNDSVAIGRETEANEANTVAIGLQTKANGNQSIALGYGALTESTANNGVAMGVNAYIGPKRTTDPEQGVPGNSTSIVDDDTVIAPEKAQMNSVAIGNAAKAFGYQNTALGAGAEAHDTNSLAVGIMAIGKGNYATALGKQAYANGKEATALGHWARAYGDNAIAIGSYAITNTLDGTGTVSNGVAIGQKARAASDNSVALGQNSLAYIPDSVKTEAYLTNEAFTAANGVVSVGNTEYTIGDDTVAANRRRITNVAGGADDYDAVNVAQLKALSTKMTQDATDGKLSSGKNITINTTTDDNGVKTNTIDLNDTITLNSTDAPGQQVTVDGKTSSITAGTGDNQVIVNGGNATITAGTEENQVTVDGSKGQVVVGGSNGIVVGKQADTATDKDGNVINPDKTGNYITGLENTTWNPAENGIVENRAATEGQLRDAVNSISTEIGDINTDIEAIQNAKRDFISDTGTKIEVGNAETLSIKGGADADSLTGNNIGVVNDGTKGFRVKLSSKLSNLDSVSTKTLTASDSITVGSGDTTTVISGDTVTTGSVTTGNTTMNNDGLTIKDGPSITADGIDAGGKTISNVGEAKNPTDAINKSTFDNTVANIGSGMNQLGNQINKLDNRVDRVGAGAAALAALHPLEYDPNTRWEVSAGIGNYRGANAVAVGAFYRPNYDTMISIGSSYGGGENMVNAGVTWRIGEGTTKAYPSKDAMAQEIDSLRSVVDDQNNKLAAQNSELAAQNTKIESQSEQLAAQTDELKAQRQQLDEQSKQIEQLMQAIAELKK